MFHLLEAYSPLGHDTLEEVVNILTQLQNEAIQEEQKQQQEQQNNEEIKNLLNGIDFDDDDYYYYYYYYCLSSSDLVRWCCCHVSLGVIPTPRTHMVGCFVLLLLIWLD